MVLVEYDSILTVTKTLFQIIIYIQIRGMVHTLQNHIIT